MLDCVTGGAARRSRSRSKQGKPTGTIRAGSPPTKHTDAKPAMTNRVPHPPQTRDEIPFKSFGSEAMRRKEVQQTQVSTHKQDVRSVMGWTDPVQHDDTPAPASPLAPKAVLPQHQKQIKRLPVPELEPTMQTYLKTLEPLLNADEFDIAEEEVRDFMADAGPKLQKLLEARGQDEGIASWLEPWWDDSYLCLRDSIAINVNYFFGFEDDATAAKMHQVGRAASLLHGGLLFYQQFRLQSLEMDFERKSPLCMSQIYRVFGASRVPQPERDVVYTYTTTKVDGAERVSKTSLYLEDDPQHVAVLVGSRFYSFNVFKDAKYETLLSIEEIEVGLAECQALAAAEDQRSNGEMAVPVELATTMNRDQWAGVRAKLVEVKGNEEILEMIQRALIVVVLDDNSPQNDEELSRLLLHGPGINRWFDKHNLIVCKNGRAGINFEHSVGDGATTLRVADEMFNHSLRCGRTAEEVEANIASPEGGSVSVTSHKWSVPQCVEEELKAQYIAFKEDILSTETQVLQFNNFGGTFIKSVAKMSPDAFAQVALQLAYHKFYGRNDATYEAASTRSFLHGRTEVVRSATSEVHKFCNAVNTTCLTHRRAGEKTPTQLKLLREAVDAHVAYMRKAKTANGVDRHLLGLRLIYEENKDTLDFPVPEIFKGVGYRKSQHWNLSTSHCGSASLCGFGFGPVVNDGFGVGYMIKSNGISFNITSKFNFKATSCTVLVALLEEALLHLRAIVLFDPEKIRSDKAKSLSFTHPTTNIEEHLSEWMSITRRMSSSQIAGSPQRTNS